MKQQFRFWDWKHVKWFRITDEMLQAETGRILELEEEAQHYQHKITSAKAQANTKHFTQYWLFSKIHGTKCNCSNMPLFTIVCVQILRNSDTIMTLLRMVTTRQLKWLQTAYVIQASYLSLPNALDITIRQYHVQLPINHQAIACPYSEIWNRIVDAEDGLHSGCFDNLTYSSSIVANLLQWTHVLTSSRGWGETI